jgi:UDP-N-acetyl-D-glucosamine dehydrogenase
LEPERVREQEAIVIVTDHSSVDYDALAEQATLIVDTRGVYREARDNVVKA